VQVPDLLPQGETLQKTTSAKVGPPQSSWEVHGPFGNGGQMPSEAMLIPWAAAWQLVVV
jgi:hypothetical protein